MNAPELDASRKLLAQLAADDYWEGKLPVDIRQGTPECAPYVKDSLPDVYENFMYASWRFWGDSSLETYAAAFTYAVGSNLRPTVQVETRPGSMQLTPIVDFIGVIGPSSCAKNAVVADCCGALAGQPLLQWSKAEFARAKEAEALKPKESRAKTLPMVLHTTFTAEAMRQQLQANSNDQLPTAVLSEEYYNALAGGAAHHANQFPVVSNMLKTAYDCNYLSSVTQGNGQSSSDTQALNVAFCSTPGAINSWGSLPAALEDGLMARFSLITPGKVAPESERVRELDGGAVSKWQQTLITLQRLGGITLRVPQDDELWDYIHEQAQCGKQAAEGGARHATWLAKLPTRVVRYAAAHYLVENIDKVKGGGLYMLPPEYLTRALHTLLSFTYQHQVLIYLTILDGDGLMESVRRFVTNTYMQLIRNGADLHRERDDICGTKSVVRSASDAVKLAFVRRLMDLRLIQPVSTRHKPLATLQQLESAGAFKIHHKFVETYDLYRTQMQTEYDTTMGLMQQSFLQARLGKR